MRSSYRLLLSVGFLVLGANALAIDGTLDRSRTRPAPEQSQRDRERDLFLNGGYLVGCEPDGSCVFTSRSQYTSRIGDEPLSIGAFFTATSGQCDDPKVARIVVSAGTAFQQSLSPGQTSCTIFGSEGDNLRIELRAISPSDWRYEVPSVMYRPFGCDLEFSTSVDIVAFSTTSDALSLESASARRLIAEPQTCGQFDFRVRFANDERPMLFTVHYLGRNDICRVPVPDCATFCP